MVKKARMGRNLNALLHSTTTAVPVADSVRKAGTEPATAVPESGASDAGDRPASENGAQSTQASSAPARAPGSDSLVDGEAGLEANDGVDHTSRPDGGAVSVTGRVDDQDGSLRSIDVARISRGAFQPRRHFDQAQLQELADSIRAQGMIQPVVVRPYGGAYELVAGERRWRAAQLAGLDSIPALVRHLDDRSVAAMALIENIQRKDLNPLEEAGALARLCEEFGMTHQQVAESVGRSRTAVSNLLRLLELEEPVKVLIDAGQLDMGHARALLGAPSGDQEALARRIIDQGLSVRAVEALVRQSRQPKGPDSTPPEETADSDIVRDPDIDRLGQALGETLGAPVRIAHRRGGAGKLEIRYTSVAELQGILAHIK